MLIDRHKPWAEHSTSWSKCLQAKKEAVAAVDCILAESQREGEGKAEAGPAKKSNRRKPAGFAVRGDAVDDSTAARRARLKAAMKSGCLKS